MTKEEIRKLANDLRFDRNDREIEATVKEFEKLEQMLSLFDQIDTEKCVNLGDIPMDRKEA